MRATIVAPTEVAVILTLNEARRLANYVRDGVDEGLFEPTSFGPTLCEFVKMMHTTVTAGDKR